MFKLLVYEHSNLNSGNKKRKEKRQSLLITSPEMENLSSQN